MGGKRCTAMTKEGKRCRGWAVRDSEARTGAALCAMHGGLERKSGAVVVQEPALYSRSFTDAEMADLQAWDEDGQRSLRAEIMYARVYLGRLLAMLGPDASLAQLTLVAPSVVGMLRAVARLMAVERAADGDGGDGMAAIMTEALAELGEEWDIDLLGEDG